MNNVLDIKNFSSNGAIHFITCVSLKFDDFSNDYFCIWSKYQLLGLLPLVTCSMTHFFCCHMHLTSLLSVTSYYHYPLMMLFASPNVATPGELGSAGVGVVETIGVIGGTG